MTSPFSYALNAELPKDSVPGLSFEPLSTNIYDAEIKALYVEPTKKGGLSATLHVVINNNEESFTFYPINVAKDKSGNPLLDSNGVPVQTNHYMKDDKVVYYTDFIFMDGLVQIATGKSLSELQQSDLIVEVYDFDTRAKVKRVVKGYKDVQGKRVKLAVQRVIETKKKKVGNEYVATTETRSKNSLIKAFDLNSFTAQEKQSGATEPSYAPEWLKKFKGVDADRTDKSVKAGLPQAQMVNAPSFGDTGLAAGAGAFSTEALSTDFT